MPDSSLEKSLNRVDYTILNYQLRLAEDLILPPFALLRLRREFLRLLKDDTPTKGELTNYRELLYPPLPVDPAVLRRVQQPAPAFVLLIENVQEQKLCAGDLFVLKVCFLGRGIHLASQFSRLVSWLGEAGLYGCSGRFRLEAIFDGFAARVSNPLWEVGPFDLTPQIRDLSQAVTPLCLNRTELTFLSPARLLKNRKPLFRPQFSELVPFVLRRVTSMIAAWAEFEDLVDARWMLAQVDQVDVVENRLVWQDWRPLDRHEEAGGVSGSVVLEGDGLRELWPLLELGSLFGLGKGAAYGAGRYRLEV